MELYFHSPMCFNGVHIGTVTSTQSFHYGIYKEIFKGKSVVVPIHAETVC